MRAPSTTLAALVAGVALAGPVAAQAPSWTVKDGVERTVFSELQYQLREPMALSPDGAWLQVMRVSPQVEGNRRTYTLAIYDVATLRKAFDRRADLRAVRPIEVSLTTRTGCEGIANVRWVGSREIAFLGCDGETEAAQIYSFDVGTRTLARHTDSRFGVVMFEKTDKAMVYLERQEHIWTSQAPQRMALFPNAESPNLFRALTPNPNYNRFATVATTPDGRTVRVSHPRDAYFQLFRYSIAPDGQRVVMVAPVEQGAVPPSWRTRSDKLRTAYWPQFQMIDLTTGETKAILDAPTGDALFAGGNTTGLTKAIWDADSRQVLLVNTALPEASPDDPRRSQTFAALVDVATMAVRETARLQSSLGGDTDYKPMWAGGAAPFVVDTFRGVRRTFDRATNAWSTAPAPQRPTALRQADLGAGYVVRYDPSEDRQPQLVLTKGKRTAPITALNPRLDTLWTAKVEPLTWTSSGVTWTGALLRGRDCRTACPMVVQIGHFQPGVYLPMDMAGNAGAGQVYAGEGISVLRIDTSATRRIPGLADPGAPASVLREGDAIAQAIEDVIATLKTSAHIDPAHVGLVGFSRTAQFVKVAITRPRTIRWAAAKSTDGGDSGSYTGYLYYAASNGFEFFRREIEGAFGGPFWQHRERWFQDAMGFHLDKVQTPILLEPHSIGAGVLDWEFYAGLKLQDKPVEMLMVPTPEHQLLQPWDIATSQQITLDWFLFWLKDEEDPDPAKADQYRRWRLLRAQQQ